MATIKLTEDLRKEINESILSFDNLIRKEMLFSSDLRNHENVIKYSNKIIELNKYLEQGWM